MGEAGLPGHVCESAVVIVVIEVIGRSVGSGEAFEFCAVDDENVWPAIVVCVEDGNAGARRFDDVLFCSDAAEDVRSGEMSVLGCVGEGCERFPVRGLGVADSDEERKRKNEGDDRNERREYLLLTTSFQNHGLTGW